MRFCLGIRFRIIGISTFTGSLNDWELESIFSLLSLLLDLDVDLRFEGEDKVIWSLDSKGTFYVESLCNRLRGSNCPYFPGEGNLEI